MNNEPNWKRWFIVMSMTMRNYLITKIKKTEMNDLIQLQDDAQKLLMKAHSNRETMLLMLESGVTDLNYMKKKMTYIECMRKYIKKINEIQKLSYEKYI